MESFKKDIETEGAGSFVMPKQPSMQTLESKFNFNFNQCIEWELNEGEFEPLPLRN